MPVSAWGVMLGMAAPSGPLGLPPRKRELSVACVIVRGLWHSPQCATARTKYSPRATPTAGAAAGGGRGGGTPRAKISAGSHADGRRRGGRRLARRERREPRRKGQALEQRHELFRR